MGFISFYFSGILFWDVLEDPMESLPKTKVDLKNRHFNKDSYNNSKINKTKLNGYSKSFI